MKRDGFLKESDNYPGATGRRFNDRDRWLVRGQLKFEPSDLISVRLIGGLFQAQRAVLRRHLPSGNRILHHGGGRHRDPANSFAALERQLGAVINDDTFAHRVSVTPGRDYQSDVREWGFSGEVNWISAAPS